MKSLSSPQQLIERLILTQLEQNVDILGIFEEMLESNNVVVMQTSVDFNL